VSKPAFNLAPGRVQGAPAYTPPALRLVVSGARCTAHPDRAAHRITANGVAQCAECYAAAGKRAGVR